MDKKKTSAFKRYFLYVLIGGLSITALIAIVAIIIGDWNDAITRSIQLTISGWIHSLAALGLISMFERDKKHPITIYSLFGITITSFIITVFNIFDVIPQADSLDITGGLYFWLIGVGLTAAILDLLFTAAKNKDTATKSALYVAASSLGLFITLCLPPVFNMYLRLPDVYGRILLAIAILGSTSTIISVVLTRLYRVKNPEAAAQAAEAAKLAAQSGKLPTWAIVLISIIGFFTLGPLLLGLLGLFFGFFLFH